MNRLDFFLAAMQAELFKRRAWVISAFTLTQEAPDAYQKDPYPYRIVTRPTGTFFINPDNTQELIQIEGTAAGQPLLSKKEERGHEPKKQTQINKCKQRTRHRAQKQMRDASVHP